MPQMRLDVQDLAGILGRIAVHSENINVVVFITNSKIPGFPHFQTRGCQLACQKANWPKEPSEPLDVDLLS